MNFSDGIKPLNPIKKDLSFDKPFFIYFQKLSVNNPSSYELHCKNRT